MRGKTLLVSPRENALVVFYEPIKAVSDRVWRIEIDDISPIGVSCSFLEISRNKLSGSQRRRGEK
jgi:hypothetical protein